MWIEINKLIAEDSNTAWFQTNDRYTIPNLLPQCNESLPQVMFREIKHIKIIERATTVYRVLWHFNLKLCCLKHLNSSNGDLRMKVIVERIRPTNNFGV